MRIPPNYNALDIRYYDEFEAEQALKIIDVLAQTPIQNRPAVMELRGITGEFLHDLLGNISLLEAKAGRKLVAQIQSEPGNEIEE